MQLIVSNEAFSSVSLDEVRRGARQRGLDGVEVLVATGGEGTSAGSLRSAGPDVSGLTEEHPPIRWLRLAANASLTELLYWGRQAHLVGAGLVLQETAVETPLCVPLALQHPTDVEAAQRATAWARMHDATTCWEIALEAVDEEAFEDVLEVTAPTLAHVRVRGTGPEIASGASDTSGMGTLLKALTLRSYSGTVALAPSARGRETAWREWLLDEHGWGCNTAAKKKAAR